MIKGKTLIELTDVNTGRVERFEDENIITNAAQLRANAMASLNTISDLNNPSKKNFPLYKGVFGGIKLFENAIIESAENWHMPKVSENTIIGYASSDTSDGSDAMRGSANIAETVVLENGMQLVWDFATSEANGTISCVCLTSGYGGEYGLNLKKTPEYKYDNTWGNIIGYDKENDVFVTVSNYSGYVTISKFKICLNNLKLDELFCKPTLVEESETTISFADCNNYYYLKVLDANTLYYVYPVSTQKINIYFYDLKTGSKKDTITIENSNMSCKNSNGYGLIKDGYLYITNNANNGVYKINLTNTSDITLFEMPEAYVISKIAELPNGDFFTIKTVFDPSTGEYRDIAGYDITFSDIVEKDGFLIAVADGSKIIYVMANELMLHSINNLETPVTKTADKTMKITYTLTYTN